MNRSENRLLPVIVRAPQDNGPRERGEFGGQRLSRPVNPYAAQLLGQDGQRRGLRGGAPVLDAARSAYLGAEYCGENDRRPSSGLILRKAI
jgi:hypothetical protein